jgi:GntR family transcriptional repressor for pyruvate dehydrogenase complex
MSERDLAVQLGVSRPILREALRSLAVLGVVEIRHGVGTIVRRPDVSVLGDFFAFVTASHSDLIDDVMQARIAIECQAIRLACQRATLFDFEQLNLALQKIVETIDDTQSGGLADHAFHSALVTAGHSNTLVTLYQAMQELLIRSHRNRRGLLTRIENGRSYLINHHREVFEALIARNPDQAEATLRQHFEIGEEFRRLNAVSVSPAATRAQIS